MFPKRLKYEKWNGCNNVIIIDLHNGYSVIAIWNKQQQDEETMSQDEFSVTLHLKENTIDKWDLIVDDWSFVATYKTINAAILKSVANVLADDFFKPFIDRFEYDLKCSELGCNLLDEERLGDK